MKFCPKCRNFYDDEGLVFCQTDGVPLVKLNQSSELWREGTEATQATHEIVRKQIRIQKLKKIAKVSVTIVIMMLVISELVRNTGISPPTNADEKSNSSSPAPIVKSNVTPRKNKTIANNPVNTNAGSPKCSDETKIISSVRKNNYEKWKEELKDEENSVKEQFSKEHEVPFDEIKMTLNFTEDDIKVTPSSDCLSAKATVNYAWTVGAIPKYNPKESLPYDCQKDLSWECKKK